MGETRALAAFAARLQFEDLPESVVAQACRLVLDDLGCCLSAREVDPDKVRIFTEYVGGYGATPESQVIGAGGLATRAPLAALANGVLSNAADNDDTHKRALMHIGSVVVPTVLALAEARDADGREVIAALVAGYEVGARVGMAVMPSHYQNWHSTATNGAFAAAAAAARIMRLDTDRTEMAFGYAGTQAAGLNAFFVSGDMTKSFHPGKAAMNGIMAAELAELGGTAPPAILEQEKGYLAAYSREPRPERLTQGLGEVWEIESNGFKVYPSILASHAPIGATLELVLGNAIAADQIEALTLETYNTVKSHFSSKQPEGPMAARVSVPFCMAVAAVDGSLGQAQFRPERLQDPVVRQVLARTEVVADPDLNKLYPDKFPARVTIRTSDGQQFQTSWDYPKGDPQNPMSDAELEDKFRGNAQGTLTAREMDRAIALIRDIPQADSILPLMDMMADAPD